MTSKVPFLLGLVLLFTSTPIISGKVVNSDKNDVISPQNETVPVLNIEDLNKTQYLNQNFRQGNYNYGYDVKPEGPNGQFHHENKSPDGIVFGCYGYVDPNDKPQITYYVSDSWGYRPVTAGNSAKVFYPSDHPEGSSEMKGTLRSWAQLQFPKLCLNYVQEILPSSSSSESANRFPPPRSIKSPAAQSKTHQPIRGQILHPGTGGKPGAPGLLSEGGYGGEGGTGGLVTGSAAANGGPGGNGGDGGSTSGSSKSNGGNGGSGGNAGTASGSSVANGGQGGHGGDGGEASGSSNASGGQGGTGGKGGSASGSSNANGGAAGSGAKGGVASGSSVALGGSGGDGGDGGNASGSSNSRGGNGGSAGRGGNASGSSTANGGNAGAGGKGGNASGSSSASAGDGGSAGNGGNASGSSTANGGSGGLGGSGAQQSGSSEKGGYSYTPPKGYGQRVQSLAGPPKEAVLPLPEAGGLLSEEQYTEDVTRQQTKPTPAPPKTLVSRPAQISGVARPGSGYSYPSPPPAQNPVENYQPGQTSQGGPVKSANVHQVEQQQQYYEGGSVPTNQGGGGYDRLPLLQAQRPTGGQSPLPGPEIEAGPTPHPSPAGNYFPGSTSESFGLHPPAFQAPNYVDRFHTTNSFYPLKTSSSPPHPGFIQVPAGVYVPPNESAESSEERDVNGLGNDSGEQQLNDCDRGYGKCSPQSNSPQGEIDYARLPGAISSNIPVIFYPDCRSNAYTRPAIVPFCPSLQQQGPPSSSSCSHQQPLTMKFPSGGNPYNNVMSSRGAYPSNVANTYEPTKSRPSKRVVRRSRRNQQSRYI